MKKNLLLIFFIGLFATGIFAQTDKRIEEIKKIYLETGDKIKECEENGEYSSVFLSELTVNKNNGSYPAVGIFRATVKFYYTYGDREKNPYPNRLMKIVIETKRSANTEKREYLFNEKEQLIFYFENLGEVEKRLYFQNETVIKFLVGDKTQKLKAEETVKLSKFVIAEKKKLIGIFQNSLDY